jgi:uncharacterized repeat protein (TIGR03833 family)
MTEKNNPRQRLAIRAGLVVEIIQKSDQRSGKLTRGTVQEILTNSSFHPYGIKVRLSDGRVGRVAKIIGDEPGRSGSDSA